MHGACHGKNTCSMFQIIFKSVLSEFTLNAVSRTAHTCSVRASSLDHETVDHTMENKSVIEAFFYKTEVLYFAVRSIIICKEQFCKKKVEKMIIETKTPQETFEVGKKIGENAKPGQIYTLTGDLGVGKTVFTQGVAAGLGITEPICSPTFTIIQEYESGRLPLYHFDVYRIGDIEEMEEIGYDDYFFGQGICLIEWADLIEEILPEKLIKVTIEKDLEKGFDYRRITVIGPENS